MRRLYSFFVCLLVLAACSPRFYQREQVARTFSQDETMDSASFRRLIDRVVHDELQKQLDIREWMQAVTVNEKLSKPDSTGAQHVTERTTTTFSGGKETSSVVAHTKDEKNQERVDSTSVHAATSVMEKEEETIVAGKVEGWMPWYVYAAALVAAVIVGFVVAVRSGKWHLMKV